MNTQIMINLPTETYHHIERWARLTERNVADFLAETIQLALPPLKFQHDNAQPSIATLPDAELLALTELQMNAEQDQRLSLLLYRQQAGQLTMPEQYELLMLMQIYQEGLLRKAQALREAVERKLIPPLEA
jgi:hypothetical protein